MLRVTRRLCFDYNQRASCTLDAAFSGWGLGGVHVLQDHPDPPQ